MYFTHTNLKDAQEFKELLHTAFKDSKPRFLLKSNIKSWDSYYTKYQENVSLFIKDEYLIGAAFTAPLCWDNKSSSLPQSIEEILTLSDAKSESAKTLAITDFFITKDFQKQAVGIELLKAVFNSAINQQYDKIIVPVRPTFKCNYPLQSMESYTSWKRSDGYYVDPCMRIFQRLNSKIIKLTSGIVFVNLTVSEWEKETDMIFPESGRFIVKDALQPVMIDTKSNLGFYMEPCVWMEADLQNDKSNY